MASAGMLALKVTKASNFNPAVDHGLIKNYRVTVSGEGIEPPIVAEFEGDASEGVVEGVPTGDNRTISVKAINANDTTIHTGEAYDVNVGGGLNEVAIQLEAVPIFTNIADGNTIDNTRLVFEVFSDPKNPVVIEELSQSKSQALINAATNVAEIHLNESTGLGRLAPTLMGPGERKFAVIDVVTNRSNEVNVLITDGTQKRAAPTVSATLTGPNARACSSVMCAPAVWMNGVW
ncbi:MAG: hypothetical protein ABH871_05680 [Pseudomonadota bacterium]